MRTSRPAHGNRPTARLVTAMLVALILAVLTAAPAMASAASVADSLAKSPVFVDPNAPIKVDTNALLNQVEAAETPIFIAVLPDDARTETNGNTDALGAKIAGALKERGTYLVTAGTKYTAASSTLNRGEAKRLAEQAFQANGQNLDAALSQFVDGVSAEARNEPAAQTGGDGGGGGGGIATVAVLAVVLVGGGALLFGARRRRREPTRTWSRSATTSGPSTWTPACPTPTRRRCATTLTRSTSTRRRPRPWTRPGGPRTWPR
jgi:hypothetical protein